ncbi:hypothetical protein ILUMI_19266 [Ignelater luminosus]|uniref:Uncharacterized protein n=1 Tax=Ignelater luminosus TaxID=2038154 RepID=A0A8K0CM12_IGNLU|nr:hypothetical protein ILUMI_19266 [Ignelater luminosus]
MSEEAIAALKSKRAVIKGQLTRFQAFDTAFDTETNSKRELKGRLENAKELKRNLEEVQASLEQLDSKTDQTAEHEQFEKLPPLNLPEYDGSYTDRRHFHDAFVAAVRDNTSYSDVQKFSYLISSLKGNAKQVIQDLPMSDENYKVAWDMVCKRFDNMRIITYSHLNALDELPTLKDETRDGLRKLLDGMQRHLRSLDNLGKSASSRDT